MKPLRRYDIDWLRVIAIGLLIFYHTGIGFQPWGVFLAFVQNDEPMESLWVPLSMLNIWRIPLLFFVSGMGVWFAIRRRNWKQLIGERARRILLPFLFGMAVIVPLQMAIWQGYYHQEFRYIFHPAHLWFLGNIFLYVLILVPLFFLLKNKSSGRFARRAAELAKKPIVLVLLMIPFVLEAVLVAPESFETYALTGHGFIIGLVAFLTGFVVVWAGSGFWENVATYKFVLLVLALASWSVRYFLFDFKAPDYLMSIESSLWIFSIFGIGYTWLQKPGPVLNYLSQAAYPVYILHMIFLNLGSVWLFPIAMPAMLKYVLLVLFTFAGCFAAFEVIRRIPYISVLFGLKPLKGHSTDSLAANAGNMHTLRGDSRQPV